MTHTHTRGTHGIEPGAGSAARRSTHHTPGARIGTVGLVGAMGVALLAASAVPASASPAPAAATQVAHPVSAGWVGGAAARRGTSATASGTAPAGAVRIDRRVAGRWAPVTSVPVGAAGRWSARFAVPAVASAQSYRAVWRPAFRAGGTPAPTVTTAALPTLDVYELDTYSVTTRGKVASDVEAFAAFAAATYADPRGWRRAHHRFARVAKGGDFTLVLAQARTLPSFSTICSVQYSCNAGRYVVVNDTPWRNKTPYFPADLTAYRRMVVNHETGHWLGLGHQYCSSRGALASDMQQQSKGMQGCRPNSWPLASDVARVTRGR